MSTHVFDSLPPRPPTPPRESSHDPMGDVPLKPTLVRPPFDPKLSLQTPPNGFFSPNSTTTHSNGSSRRSGKNVAFASLTEYKEPPQYGAENRGSPPSGPLIPSAKASKPPKGILKPFSSPNPLELSFNTANGAVSRRSLVDMLESSLRQLAGDDRADKVDAYGTLSSALKASNNLPDRVALQDRMPRFMEYIQRDITTTPFDPPLANHALTFLSTVLFFTGVSSSLTNEFGIFIIDHCIRSFGDSTVPKDVTRHLLQVVAQQNFSARVMTLDRVTRLLTALHNIENHVTGKSIVHSRIVIYRHLMKQCRPAMLAHTGWLQDLITDTISTTRDIRNVAIAFGFEASLSIGKDRQISKKLAELFRSSQDESNPADNQPSERKREYIDLYIERLKGMLRSRQDPASVPRIWSVILLLLRGIQLDKWQSLNPWLRIIQQCFNTSDMQTRREANYAWNRFVYVLYLEEVSFSKLLGSTLCSPVCSQWKRKANAAKNDDEFQTAIFGSACNLFYYMFKPGVSHAQLDKYWDRGFKQIMQQLCAQEQGDERYDQAIRIFTNLFDTTTRRQWTEDRVLQNPVADASELPPLDPKWLRRNAARVFQLVQPILERKFSDLADGSSPVTKMWQTLITSVSSAASKEIKVSFDTTDFISHVFTSLLALWRHGVSPVAEGQDEEKQRRAFLTSTRVFVTTVVSAFGVLPFTEKQLCSREDVFTPVTTPSHRLSKATSGIVLTPLHHLFSILSSIPEGVQDDEAFSDFFEAVFRPFFRTKNPKASSDLVQEMINSIPMDTVCPYGPWAMAAGAVKAALGQGQPRYKSATLGLPSSNEVPVGREYRDLCKMLERGFKSTPNLPSEHWFTLFGAFETHVGEETGDAGRAVAVVEPLAKMILEHIATTSEGLATKAVFAASALLLISKQPTDRQTVDAARRRLWGTTIAKSPTFDPFDNLYKLSNFLMEHLYKNLGIPGAADLATTFMEDLETFLARCNSSLVVRTISILQDGLVYWIKDDESRLSSRQTAETASAAKQVWDRICQIISVQESPATINLESVERLFCAAFQSKHRHVVNSMAVLWNRVFGDSEEMAYPDELKDTLIAIRPIVDIVLPGLGESSQESAGAGQHAFVESQDDMDVLNISPIKSSRSERLRLVSSGSSIAPTPIPLRHNDTKPPAQRTSKNQTKPKLRHEDSQLQFEPIESASADVEVSQVLTDRQMEVRERQREEDALYNMRSSSPIQEDGLQVKDVPPSPQLPEALDETPKKRTPAMQTTYDYVNSTPTPRRGQMLPLVHDIEMSDPPSSPPEFSQVRRYPLVPEIRSRSGDEDVNWEYTSSPVSGSPLPSRVLPLPEDEEEKELSREGAEPAVAEDDADDDADDVAVADSFAVEVVPSSGPAENKPVAPGKVTEPKDLNSTPTRRRTRQSTRVSPRSAPSTPRQGSDSPTSANEEFVDALTSPRARTSKRSKKSALSSSRQSGDTSFALSECAEQGLIQLADEVEAKYRQAKSKRSPKVREDKAIEGGVPVLDCITVVAADDDEEEQTPRRKGERVIPSTPHVDTPSERGSRRSTSGGRKRKRGSGSRQHDTRSKRQRSGSRTDDNESTTSSPSFRRRKGAWSQEEEEVQSQVISEHMAASSQSRLSPELGEDMDLSKDVETGDVAGRASTRKSRRRRASRSSTSGSSNSPIRKKPAHRVERHLKKALERVQAATISREEMYRIEDLFVDFKRELYEAERRGRQE